MYKTTSDAHEVSLFWELETMLNCKHPLFRLENLVDWGLFEKTFSLLYCHNNERPAKPIRLMTGLPGTD